MMTSTSSSGGQLDFNASQLDLCALRDRLNENATGKTSFLGKKRIVVGDEVLPVTIGELRERISRAGESRCEDPEFTLTERRAGLELLTKVQELNNQAKADVRCWNIFTKIMSWFRETSFSLGIKDTNSQVPKGDEYFRAFTQESFKKAFGVAVQDDWEEGLSAFANKDETENLPTKKPEELEKQVGYLFIATLGSMQVASEQS